MISLMKVLMSTSCFSAVYQFTLPTYSIKRKTEVMRRKEESWADCFIYGKEKIGVVSKTERFSLLISLIHIFP